MGSYGFLSVGAVMSSGLRLCAWLLAGAHAKFGVFGKDAGRSTEWSCAQNKEGLRHFLNALMGSVLGQQVVLLNGSMPDCWTLLCARKVGLVLVARKGVLKRSPAGVWCLAGSK